VVNGQGDIQVRRTQFDLVAYRALHAWRYLDFFQYEAWLHAELPRVKCTACAKTNLVEVLWARPGSRFTLLFEALALSLCHELPVAQAADLLRVSGKRLRRRIAHYVGMARAKDDMSDVRLIGIHETSVERGQHHITVVHDPNARRHVRAPAGRARCAGVGPEDAQGLVLGRAQEPLRLEHPGSGMR